MNEQEINRRIQLMREHEAKLMKEYGFVVHYVFETDKHEFNGMINAHTEGVQENFGHLDLQIVLPLPQETVHPVLTGMVHRIKTEGVVFEPDTKNSEVLEGYDVYLKVFTHHGKDVLRVILPDAKGRLPFDEGCEAIYKQQMDELE